MANVGQMLIDKPCLSAHRGISEFAYHERFDSMDMMRRDEDEQAPGQQMSPDLARMLLNARSASEFLKSLSHPSRLVILCRLAQADARVNELESTLGIPQAAVSKQLARLRDAGLVTATRDGRSVVYALADERARRIVLTLYAEFCS